MNERCTGTVERFDEGSGLGEILLGDGRRIPFHCVSIADGSRRIDPGTSVSVRVEFRVVRLEAVDIVPD